MRYRVTADTKPFQDAVHGAQHQFEEFGATLVKGFGLGGGFALGEKAAEALVDAIKEVPKAFIEMVAHVVEYGHEIEIASAKTGLSTKAVQELSVAARLTGTTLADMTGLVGKMEKAIGGGSEAFKHLGLSIEKLKAMAPDEAFRAVVTRLGEIHNQSEQAAAGAAIFGKAWQSVAAIIKDPEVLDSASRLGAILGEQDVESAANLARAGKELSVAWEAVQNQFAAAVIENPELLAGLKGLVDATAELAKWVHENRGAIGLLVKGGWDLAVSVAGVLEAAVRKLGGAYLWIAEKVMPEFIAEVKAGLKEANEAAITAEAVHLAKGALAPKRPGGGGGGYNPKSDDDAKKRVADIDHAMAAYKQSYESMENEINAFLIRTHHLATSESEKYWKEQEKQASEYGKWYLSYLTAQQAAQNAIAHAWEEEQRRQHDEAMAALADIADFGDALQNLGETIGSGLLSNLGDAVMGWAQFAQAAENAQTATQKATVAMEAASSAYKKGSVLGGAARGAAAGSMFGPWGAAVGAVAGGVLGFLGKKHNESAELKGLHSEFDALSKAASKAGVAISSAFDTFTAKGLSKAIGELKHKLDTHAEAQEKLNDAVQRYGFTIEELGPAWQRQKLDEMAGQLYQDYELLTASGIKSDTVLQKMGASLNDYVHTAVASGQEVPQAMQGMIDRAIELGLITDENGNAYNSAADAGITYALTMSQALTELVAVVKDLKDALLGVSNTNPTTTVTVRRRVINDDDGGTVSGGQGGGNGGAYENPRGFASGGFVPATPGGRVVRVGEGGEGEFIVPASKMRGGAGATVHVNMGDVSLSGGVDLAAFQQAIERGTAQGVVTAMKKKLRV